MMLLLRGSSSSFVVIAIATVIVAGVGGGRHGGGVVHAFINTNHHHPVVSTVPHYHQRNKLVGGKAQVFSTKLRHLYDFKQQITTMSATAEATDDDDNNSDATSSSSDGGIMYSDIIKYFVATTIQYYILSFGLLNSLDKYVMPNLPTMIPKSPLVAILFIFLSLRSRIASVLDNSRPKKSELAEGAPTPIDVKRPSWTPPRIAFPFIWLTITALRGISTALIYNKTKVLCCNPINALIWHLSIGDTWNTITNVEKRLGVSAVGVLFVWGSVWNAIVQYYKSLPLASYILLPSGIWISIATILTWTIWNMNDRKPLVPRQGDGDGSAAVKIGNLLQFQFNSIGGRLKD